MNSWHYLVFWFEFLHACLVLMCLLMASTQNDIVLIKMHHFEFFWATSESFKIIHIIFYYSLPILFLCHFLLWYFPIILIPHTNTHTMPKLSYVPLTMINYVTITYTPSFGQTFTQGSFSARDINTKMGNFIQNY